MAHQEGTLKLSSNLESRFNAPLDARTKVQTVNDLLSLPYTYTGLLVFVVEDGGLYNLIGDDPSKIDSWKNIKISDTIQAGSIKLGELVFVNNECRNYNSLLSYNTVDTYVLRLVAEDGTFADYIYYRDPNMAVSPINSSYEMKLLSNISMTNPPTSFYINENHNISTSGISFDRYTTSQNVVSNFRIELYKKTSGMIDQSYNPTSTRAQSGTAVAQAVAQSSGSQPYVNTKTDLYSLTNTYRGMIVYVKDEDEYYKLVNDLPSYEASWEVYSESYNLIEMTDAEIDALFA